MSIRKISRETAGVNYSNTPSIARTRAPYVPYVANKGRKKEPEPAYIVPFIFVNYRKFSAPSSYRRPSRYFRFAFRFIKGLLPSKGRTTRCVYSRGS